MKFRELAEAYEKIEKTSGRLEMMVLLAEIFKATSAREIRKVVYLSQGIVAPPFEGIEVGMGEKFVIQAIAQATGYPKEKVTQHYKKSGDLGITAAELIKEKKQRTLAAEALTVEKVFETLMKIAKTGGAGSHEKKIGMLVELLNNSTPLEAKYIVRFPIGKLRLGIGDPTMLEALSIARTGGRELREPLERAYNLCSDLGHVAEVFYSKGEKGIRDFEIELFKPVRPALAERLSSAEEIIKKIGKCAVEAKYDGFRVEVHKRGNEVRLYSRRLEQMTGMFPEVVEGVRKQVRARDAIFEGEALAVNEQTGEFYPFQMTIQRKREHGVAEKAEEFPLRLFAFDLIYADGKDYTQEPYAVRRKKLEQLISPGERIAPSEKIVTDDAKELQKYFDQCVERGLEGIIAKDLKAPYIAGARKFAWIKLKRSYRGELSDTIDVVIVGYYLGRGARAEFGFGGVLGAVYDDKEDLFKTITKIGSGFTERQMVELRELLRKIKTKEKPARVDALIEPDFWVEPRYVITVMADEITRSPTHTAGRDGGETGYALRFPRMVGEGVRKDKGPEDATTVDEIVKMYRAQKRLTLVERP